MNTLPIFKNVFFYGRWSDTNNLLDDFIKISYNRKAEWCNSKEYMPDLDSKPLGYLLTSDEDEAATADFDMHGIMIIIERIREHIKGEGMHSTCIESMHWKDDDCAYVELSCL